MIELRPLKIEHLSRASALLSKQHSRVAEMLGLDPWMSIPLCEDLIRNEMDKDHCLSLAAFKDNRFIGYAIAQIQRLDMFGLKGRVPPAGFALEEKHALYLGEIYRELGQVWKDKGLSEHIIHCFAGSDEIFESLCNLGFARQQAYGILSDWSDSSQSAALDNQEINVRRAVKSDRDSISSFSRSIALFQKQSPCFAEAPEEYLIELDEGFSTLVDENEGELYVVEDKGEVLGYQLFESFSGMGFLNPPGSTELVVSAVKETARGKGLGRALTSRAFEDQVAMGRKIFLTDWRCANLRSSRFWPKQGFKPFLYRMIRKL